MIDWRFTLGGMEIVTSDAIPPNTVGMVDPRMFDGLSRRVLLEADSAVSPRPRRAVIVRDIGTMEILAACLPENRK